MNFAPARSTNIHKERIARKHALVCGLRVFSDMGFSFGLSGHMTVRDPERLDCFWINPLDVNFKSVRVSDLCLSDSTGQVINGKWRINASGVELHSAIYRNRPDVLSVAHVHCTYGKAFSSLKQHLEPLTQDACAFYEDHALFDEYSGVAADELYGERVADSLGHRKAAILANHGFLTVGPTVEAATWWYIAMSDAARVQLLVQGAGVAIPHEIARRTAFQVGTQKSGTLSARPLFESIMALSPEAFD